MMALVHFYRKGRFPTQLRQSELFIKIVTLELLINCDNIQSVLQYMEKAQETSESQMSHFSEHCQAAISAINEFYNNVVADPQSLQGLSEKVQSKQVIQQLSATMASSFNFITEQLKQKACSFVNYFIQQAGKRQGCFIVAANYLQILFNFKIHYKLKRIFIKSVSEFRVKQRQLLGNLFERALILTIEMLESLQQAGEIGVHSQLLQIDKIQSQFAIHIEWPKDRKEVYSTIIIMGEILLENLELEDESYGFQLAQIFRRYTQLILSKDFLQTQPKLVEELLNFWKEFLIQDFICCDDDQRDKTKKFYNILKTVCSWNSLYEGMINILKFYSPAAVREGQTDKIYNLLYLEEHWEADIYYTIKQSAAMVIGQLIEIDGNIETKTSSEYCKQLLWSIIHSLNQLVGSEHTISFEQQQTCLELLQLLGGILKYHNLLSEGQQQHLFEEILIPLFEYYLQENLPQYKDNVQAFIGIIEDCSEDQRQETMIAKIAKIMEILVDQNEQTSNYVYKFIISSLMSNKNHIESVGNSQNLPAKNIKNTTAFLLLCVFAYKSEAMEEHIESLRELFVVEYISLLSQIEVALIYEYFCFTQMYCYYDMPIATQLITSTLMPEMSPNLRVFAINMLYNLEQNLWKREHIQDLVSIFGQLEDIPKKYLVLEKIMAKRLDLFLPNDLVVIIENCIVFIALQIDLINNAIQNKGSCSTVQVFSYLKVCQKIARDRELLQNNKILVLKLWLLVQQIQKVKHINFDDQIIKIANLILDNVPELPENILVIFNKIKQAFMISQFYGCGYYQFFEKVHKKCTQEQNDLANKAQYTMLEVACFFIHHPQLHTLDLDDYLAVCNSLWVIQSMLLNKSHLTTAFLHDVKQIVEQFPQFNKKVQLHPSLQVRFINLTLSLAILDQEQDVHIDYGLITDLANRMKIYDYQSKLLVYLLTQLLPRIDGEIYPVIWVIFIYLMREEAEKFKINKKSEIDRKYTALLGFIEPPVLLQRNLEKQIACFVSRFRKIDFKGYQISLNKLKQQDYDQINSFLKGSLQIRKFWKAVGIKTTQNQDPVVVAECPENLKSILRVEDEQNIPKQFLRTSPFQRMINMEQYSDQEERQLFINESRMVKKTRIDLYETKKQVIRMKVLNKQKVREN